MPLSGGLIAVIANHPTAPSDTNIPVSPELWMFQLTYAVAGLYSAAEIPPVVTFLNWSPIGNPISVYPLCGLNGYSIASVDTLPFDSIRNAAVLYTSIALYPARFTLA